ncbi:MAG: 50S ribosomal protein L3 [Patescibacteria group bacterium]|nr:50S ribosomal protein L3 [Patescibacteria group bacterium]
MEVKAKKLNMSRIFTKGGAPQPVTLVKVDDLEDFEVGDLVVVSGKTKGKGFAGVIKRWGFKGGPRTHGQSDRERAPGSIGGTTDPGRVWPGKKMPGRMGGNNITVKGLEILEIDEENNILKIKGSIPGPRGNEVTITKKER